MNKGQRGYCSGKIITFQNNYAHQMKISKFQLSKSGVELIAPLFRNAKLLDLAVEKALKADGSFIAINNRISQSVSHLYIHIVPRRKGDGLKGFFWPRYPYKDKDEMVKIQQIIKDTLKSLNI